ncbi:hypothetical protein DES53_11660 [Roseimicrobium gellanilyticum]|uniref:Uncharacterized protein n=1 Tax=Roseimicrobium gellanilyticum TaxID=748857 RepID=A0A366H3Q1_9BACT|nr:hypothetical protein [Roseimicrobium gellanilyticum]RBP36621.1 hypothetical protein DES53_11660 [Roseimicrobium gellanilyticum]
MRTLLIVSKVTALLVTLAFAWWIADWHLDRQDGREVLSDLTTPKDPVGRQLKERLDAGARAWIRSSLLERDMELIGCYPPRMLWDRATFTCANVRERRNQAAARLAKFVFIVSPEDWSVIFKYDPREFVQKRKMEIANMSAELQPRYTADLRKLCEEWKLDFDS